MMRYALLCHFNERAWSDIPQAERDVIMERYHAVIDELHKDGWHRLSSQLDSVTEAIAVRSGAAFVWVGAGGAATHRRPVRRDQGAPRGLSRHRGRKPG